MNYPLVLSNPLLQKKLSKADKDKEQQGPQFTFDNMSRPISGYQHTKFFARPFSTKEGAETLMQRRKELQFKSRQRLETSNPAVLDS